MNPKLLLGLALVLGGNLFASEPAANNPPQTGVHNWEYIQYPRNLPNCPTFVIGWPSGGTEKSEEFSRGLRLDIMDIAQGFRFFKTNAIAARLYRANGGVVEPTPEGKKLLNAPVAIGTASFADEEPDPQVMTYFPWGANTLAESWLEVTIGPERYWLEIPYGFDRNPADPLPPTIPGGTPQFIPVMKSLTEHEHVVRWENVHYNLGRTQDGGELSLIQANPFDAVSDVDIYNFPKTQNVYSPHSDVRLLEADGMVIKGQCVNLHLDDNHLRRTDTFDIFDRGADDLRCWGQIEVRVDDQPYRVVVPSSLYKYVHGHARQPAASDFLSTLRAGMTLGETERTLKNYNCTRKLATATGGRSEYEYIFAQDAGMATLRFDESGRLVNWK